MLHVSTNTDIGVGDLLMLRERRNRWRRFLDWLRMKGSCRQWKVESVMRQGSIVLARCRPWRPE